MGFGLRGSASGGWVLDFVFGIWGSGFGFFSSDFGSRVWDFGYWGIGTWVWNLRLEGWSIDCRVPGFEFRVSCFVFEGLGFLVSCFRVWGFVFEGRSRKGDAKGLARGR